jgi:ubiquinone/menaquinone biosynthesis C-methylase UbiE
MFINSKKQQALGYAGLALLRNWLIGNASTIRSIFKEISVISGIEKDNINDNRQNAKEHDIKTGYQIWSNTYDTENNILIQVEEPVVKSIVKKFTPGTALDAACGTGRYSIFLDSLGFAVTGIDLSEDMLRIAKQKNGSINYIRADLNRLPFADGKFNLVVCGLAIHYVKNINKVMQEFSRVLRPGGHIVISSIHPWQIVLGAHAEFHDKKTGWGYIKENIFWHSSYVRAFNRAGLKILQCEEPKIRAKQIRILQNGSRLSPITVSQALAGLPVTVIWVLEKSTYHESKKGA